MADEALEQLVEEVRDLPLTVSDVLAQVITECDNADASVSSLSRIMSSDQALAAMILKLANSAYYGYARRIESLPDAVVLLGFASVKNLAITASITRLLASDRDDLSGVRATIFDHCLTTAICARMLGRTRRVSGEKAFVAGLLHDLGMIVLVCYAKDQFRALYARSVDNDVPIVDVELDVLGWTHSELGARVASEWQFPATLCDALRWHHDPTQAKADPLLAQTVHLANWLAHRLGHSIEGVPGVTEADPLRSRPSASTPTRSRASKIEAAAEISENESFRTLGNAA